MRYFAAAADAAGRTEETLTVAGETVGDLHDLLADRYGERMLKVLRSGSILVDGVVSRDRTRALGSAVDVLPRFSGG